MVTRAFYSLDTAAQQIKCSVADLLHLGGQGRLPLFANIAVSGDGKRIALRGGKPVSQRRRSIGQQQPLSDSDDQVRELQQEARQIQTALKRMCAQDTPLGLYWLFPEDIRRTERPSPFPLQIKTACRFDDGLRVFTFNPPMMVDLGNLVVLPSDLAEVAALVEDESVADRNKRWLEIWNEEIRTGQARGAQSRAIDRIVKMEGHTRSAVKAALQRTKRNAVGSTFGSLAGKRVVHRMKG